jgi:hypothetical protein
MTASNKFLIIFIFLFSFIQSQNNNDFSSNNPASDNWNERNRSANNLNMSSVVVFSNVAVADVFVWNYPFQSTERTFPALISLPIDNQIYTISLFSENQFKEAAYELQNFDFENREIKDFEIMQDHFEKMRLATRTVRPIPGTESAVFLTYCDENDVDCIKGMHWLDQFYAKYYDSKQENILWSEINGTDLTEQEKDLVKQHRIGVARLVTLFSLAVYLIDNAAL